MFQYGFTIGRHEGSTRLQEILQLPEVFIFNIGNSSSPGSSTLASTLESVPLFPHMELFHVAFA